MDAEDFYKFTLKDQTCSVYSLCDNPGAETTDRHELADVFDVHDSLGVAVAEQVIVFAPEDPNQLPQILGGSWHLCRYTAIT